MGIPKKQKLYAFLVMLAVVTAACSDGSLEEKARSKAQAFCGRAVTGASLAPLAEQAQSTGQKTMRQVGKNKVRVGFIGIPPFSRHICEIEAKNGKITKASYYHID